MNQHLININNLIHTYLKEQGLTNEVDYIQTFPDNSPEETYFSVTTPNRDYFEIHLHLSIYDQSDLPEIDD